MMRIETPDILARLMARLSLQRPATGPPVMGLYPIILPTIDVGEQALGVPEFVTATVNLQVAIGDPVIAHTVPAGEKWQVLWMGRGVVTAQYGRLGLTNGTIYIPMHAGGTGVAFVNLVDTWITTGSSIYCEGTNNAGDTAVAIKAMVRKEKA